MKSGPELEVAALFAEVARGMAAGPDCLSTTADMSKAALAVVGCDWAGLARINDRGALSFPKQSESVVDIAFGIVASTGEGVIPTAVHDNTTTIANDLATEHRWPQYCAEMLEKTPVRSAAAYKLRLAEEDLGVVALYSREPGFFEDKVREVATVFADHAALALGRVVAAERTRNLEIALETNRGIGIAIGVLMARHSVTDAEAFDMLRTTSQHVHVKLREIAEYVAMTGDLPTAEPTAA